MYYEQKISQGSNAFKKKKQGPTLLLSFWISASVTVCLICSCGQKESKSERERDREDDLMFRTEGDATLHTLPPTIYHSGYTGVLQWERNAVKKLKKKQWGGERAHWDAGVLNLISSIRQHIYWSLLKCKKCSTDDWVWVGFGVKTTCRTDPWI